MIFKSILMKLARKIVGGLMQKVFSQMNVVDQILNTTIRGFISEIMSGAWQGDDAEAFAQELSSTITGMGNPVVERIKFITTAIDQATSIIDSADSKVSGLVGGLADKFASIF